MLRSQPLAARPALFATTPPALFPPILGLMGLVPALRRVAAAWGMGVGAVEILAGALLALWAFAVLALKTKALHRPSVLVEDMRPLPGRAGLAAATMSGMAAGALIAPYLPRLALALILAALVAHAVLALVLAASLRALPPEARGVNPTLHLSLVGFIVAAPSLAQMGWTGLAEAIFWPTLLAAAAIWALSARNLLRDRPPAPLRPLMAIHLAPAALLSTSAMLIGRSDLALALAALALIIFVALLARLRWITSAGFSPMWGAFTFPLAAFCTTLQLQTGPLMPLGQGLTLAVLAINGAIAWKVLKLWPANRLAQKTNAARA